MSENHIPDEQSRYHREQDPHTENPKLADVVLGGQDGLVNVLGVLLGVAVATVNAQVVVTAGLAAAFAESVSMAAVAFTSSRTQGELYESERARELRHITKVPDLEREEVREMYARKGFSGELLERIVQTITQDPQVWVAVMMSEEHGLVPVSRAKALRSAVVVGVSALIGSLIPLVPFFFMTVRPAIGASLLVSSASLFAFGYLKTRWTVGVPMRGGLELTVIGMASALVGYAIGLLFPVPVG